MICMCVSLWAWWEVVAAHHRVHDHACCHLQADCLESGISSGPLRSTMSMGTSPAIIIRPCIGWTSTTSFDAGWYMLVEQLSNDVVIELYQRVAVQPLPRPIVAQS